MKQSDLQKQPRRVKLRNWRFDAADDSGVTVAVTKSEARSHFKKMARISRKGRMPIGVLVVEVKP